MTIYDASNIPEITRESIDAWAQSARPTGGFLRAVLENDLREAFSRADYDNTLAMPAIMSYVYNNVPSLCWGSPERVAEWPVVCDQLNAATAKLNRVVARQNEKARAESSPG